MLESTVAVGDLHSSHFVGVLFSSTSDGFHCAHAPHTLQTPGAPAEASSRAEPQNSTTANLSAPADSSTSSPRPKDLYLKCQLQPLKGELEVLKAKTEAVDAQRQLASVRDASRMAEQKLQETHTKAVEDLQQQLTAAKVWWHCLFYSRGVVV